jgi:metallo-beta-lactamase family protein
MQITVLGAAREVTGSCCLVQTKELRFLVDCGMFQGGREEFQRNLEPFPFRPSDIDFVILTHAHIDHSGLLPKLAREGFSGPVHCTPATADLLAVMLPDSGFIQETEAKRRSRDHSARVQPLYTAADARACLRLLRTHDYDEDVKLHRDARCRFRDAGHILGSAIIELWLNEDSHTRKIVFSGDLGQPGRPIVRDPTPIAEADIVFIEGTYGDRTHKPLGQTLEELAAVVRHTLHEKRGNVIVPAFAVGRTQEIIYYLHDLTRQEKLDGIDIVVDSPLAAEVTRLTMRHLDVFDEQARLLSEWRAAGVGLPGMRFTASVEESIALNTVRSGLVIISASGMCDAGRVKHHLRHRLGNPQDTIMIVGFQAQGTLGRRLVEREREVRIFGQPIAVRAEIAVLNGLSAHADREALLGWARGFQRPPARAFVMHGEAETADGFAARLHNELGWNARAPNRGEAIKI